MIMRIGHVAIAALVAVVAAAATPVRRAEQPWSRDGHTGRILLGGMWGRRMDPANRGIHDRWAQPSTRLAWRRVTVPDVWNARLTDANGSIAWYRRSFAVPHTATGLWRLRFESTQQVAIAWVDGVLVGRHRGGFLPWETRIMALASGEHELRVRIDNRTASEVVRTGGYAWWNWGGLSREVYLRPVGTTDLRTVAVLPRVNRDGSATLDIRAQIENPRAAETNSIVRVQAAGETATAAPTRLAPDGSATVLLRLTIPHPELWSPSRPYLYPVRIFQGTPGHVELSYETHVGVRTIAVVHGQLLLNGHRLFLRGVALHDYMPGVGAALGPRDFHREVAELRALGVNATRAQYPLHPALVEEFDRQGILLWADAPIGWVSNRELGDPEHRRIMLDYVRTTIVEQMQHASIWLWGIGNELAIHERPAPALDQYVREAAALARHLDGTRPVGATFEAHVIGFNDGRAYAPLDVLGVNAYFGWYGDELEPGTPSFHREVTGFIHTWSDRTRKAIVVAEAGAEGAAPGQPTQRGSFEFQDRLLRSYLRAVSSAPLLDGIVVWTLRDFPVRPGWSGGNRYHGHPPFTHKGLITRDGWRKPAFVAVGAEFRRLARQHPTP